jgi:hypothetical protein
MKTTFIMGVPRCGSLALSIMLNNSYCLAHHEGFDFETAKEGSKWEHTYAGKRWLQAREEGKNFVSCDISMNPPLIFLFKEYLSKLDSYEKSDIETPTIIYINVAISKSCESLLKIIGDKVHFDHLLINLRLLSLSMISTVKYMKDNYKWRGASISKYTNEDPRFFTRSQIMDIATACGANDKDGEFHALEMDRMYYLSRCNLSVSSSLLHESMLAYNDNHDNPTIAEIPPIDNTYINKSVRDN